jgi:uncharacterized protein
MEFLNKIDPNKEKTTSSAIFLIIGITLLAMVIGNVIGLVVMMVIGNLNFNGMLDLTGSLMKAKNGWWALMLGQGVVSLISFFGAGIFYWLVVEKKKFSDLSFKQFPNAITISLIFAVQLCLTPIMGLIGTLNQNMKFPASLRNLEIAFKAMEDTMAEITKFLTTFNSPFEFLAAFLVIAVIAGLGEELLFRGLIQRKIMLGLNNHHAAIWIAAIIFSAIHFQFYGFFPRLILGALFGYIYYWTGNIWAPIIAHIFNNGLAVTMLYLVHLKKISPEIEKMDNFSMPVTIGFSIVSAGLLYLVFSKSKTNEVA